MRGDEQPGPAVTGSALAFAVGALLPLAAILLPSPAWRVPVTVVAVLIALALTDAIGARLGGNDPRLPVLRVVIGGALALAITYGIGTLVGGAVA